MVNRILSGHLMEEPIFSPDGKWMWTGSEWIPAPPSSASGADSTINLEDSMMSGNVNIEQNSIDESSTINLKDSAMSGDINITQNNAEDIATAMVQALERIGFSGQQNPVESKPKQEKGTEQVLDRSNLDTASTHNSNLSAPQQFRQHQEQFTPIETSSSSSMGVSSAKPSQSATLESSHDESRKQFQEIRLQYATLEPRQFREVLQIAGLWRVGKPITDDPLSLIEARAKTSLADPAQTLLSYFMRLYNDKLNE